MTRFDRSHPVAAAISEGFFGEKADAVQFELAEVVLRPPGGIRPDNPDAGDRGDDARDTSPAQPKILDFESAESSIFGAAFEYSHVLATSLLCARWYPASVVSAVALAA